MNLTTEAKLLIGTGLATLLLLFGGVFFLSGRDKNITKESVKRADPAVLGRADANRISTDSARVTVVEFGDFECPACGAAHPVVLRIQEEYSGRINYIFRHFPLTQHNFGQTAAEAAEAAGAQGKFWEMYNKLYETQSDWGANLEKELTPLNRGKITTKAVDMFVGYAQEMDLDTERFSKEVSENKYNDKIQRDISDGYSLGVNSTPTFFINGQKLVGVPSFEDFKSKIDSELQK